MNKQLIIMRGLPGSGKSTLAKQKASAAIQSGMESVAICGTDSYFIVDGIYRFDRTKLGLYHKKNIARVAEFMCNSVKLIIVDNTNTTQKEMEPYKILAEKWGYTVTECLMEASLIKNEKYIRMCAERNIHNVPYEHVQIMSARFEI